MFPSDLSASGYSTITAFPKLVNSGWQSLRPLLFPPACRMPFASHRLFQIGWANIPKPRFPVAATQTSAAVGPKNSPDLIVPPSLASRTPTPPLTLKADEGELSDIMADFETVMEEILPLEARSALLDYKPGDVVVTATGRGWHLIKVRVHITHSEGPEA